jgi:hypothetical protein
LGRGIVVTISKGFVTVITTIAIIFGGWLAIADLLDTRYIRTREFELFEARQYVRDLNHNIDNAVGIVERYEAKIVAGQVLTEWEVDLYETAKSRKQKYTLELDAFITPVPER